MNHATDHKPFESRVSGPEAGSVVDRFAAPWGRLTWTVTAFVAVLLAGESILLWVVLEAIAPWARWLPLVLTMLVVGVVGLFAVRGYVLEDGALWVRRLGWWTRVDLARLRSVEEHPGALDRAWRLLGNGGLFAFVGRFRNRELGSFRAWVTDRRRTVVLRLDGPGGQGGSQDGEPAETVVVSPADPAAFVERVRRLTGAGGAGDGA